MIDKKKQLTFSEKKNRPKRNAIVSLLYCLKPKYSLLDIPIHSEFNKKLACTTADIRAIVGVFGATRETLVVRVYLALCAMNSDYRPNETCNCFAN